MQHMHRYDVEFERNYARLGTTASLHFVINRCVWELNNHLVELPES
jgi:hypothetical protein